MSEDHMSTMSAPSATTGDSSCIYFGHSGAKQSTWSILAHRLRKDKFIAYILLVIFIISLGCFLLVPIQSHTKDSKLSPHMTKKLQQTLSQLGPLPARASLSQDEFIQYEKFSKRNYPDISDIADIRNPVENSRDERIQHPSSRSMKLENRLHGERTSHLESLNVNSNIGNDMDAQSVNSVEATRFLDYCFVDRYAILEQSKKCTSKTCKHTGLFTPNASSYAFAVFKFYISQVILLVFFVLTIISHLRMGKIGYQRVYKLLFHISTYSTSYLWCWMLKQLLDDRSCSRHPNSVSGHTMLFVYATLVWYRTKIYGGTWSFVMWVIVSLAVLYDTYFLGFHSLRQMIYGGMVGVLFFMFGQVALKLSSGERRRRIVTSIFDDDTLFNHGIRTIRKHAGTVFGIIVRTSSGTQTYQEIHIEANSPDATDSNLSSPLGGHTNSHYSSNNTNGSFSQESRPLSTYAVRKSSKSFTFFSDLYTNVNPSRSLIALILFCFVTISVSIVSSLLTSNPHWWLRGQSMIAIGTLLVISALEMAIFLRIIRKEKDELKGSL